MKIKHIGLLGLGTVGSGVARIIRDHQEKIQKQFGFSVQVDKVLVRDPKKIPEEFRGSFTVVSDYREIMEDPAIDLVVEVMGGIDFAKECLEAAFFNHKPVVTANKDLIAAYGKDLTRQAEEAGVSLRYEASTAGGIPILRALRESLAGDKLESVTGILNGTTNFILTKMTQEGADYAEVLKEAQALGFAEADPTSDVDGLDALRKVVILCKIAFGADVPMAKIPVQGIREVTPQDIQLAKDWGLVMKLLGRIQTSEQGEIFAEVAPFLVAKGHPLSQVDHEMNSIYTQGKASGTLMFYGAGAGELPTASAVLGDLLTICQELEQGVRPVAFARYEQELAWMSEDEVQARHFFHLAMAKDSQSLTPLLDQLGIHLEKSLVGPHDSKEGWTDFVGITELISYAQRQEFMARVEACDRLVLRSVYGLMD